MERSGNFNFYLPSRDADDIADINQISENFKVIDEKLFETSEVANSLRKDADEGKFKGEKGDKGDDYVLTEEDKEEIAEIVKGSTTDNYYYPTLKGAIADVNADTIGVNATATKETAVASIRIVDSEKVVTLLKDTTENAIINITTNMTLDLNGKCLTFGTYSHFQLNSENVTFTVLGDTRGSRIVKNVATTTKPEALFVVPKGTLKVIGGKYETMVGTSSANYVYCVYSQGTVVLEDCKFKVNLSSGTAWATAISNLTGGKADILNCEVITNSTASQNSSALLTNSNSETTAKNSKFFADGIEIVENGEYIAISLGILNLGTIELIDCQSYGLHSGIETTRNCYINGGLYEGVQHGGIYCSATGTEAAPVRVYVENATLLSSECKGVNKAQYNYHVDNRNVSGLYLGNGAWQEVYLDNCIIRGGESWDVVVKGGYKKLFMTNCKLDRSVVHFAEAWEVLGGTIPNDGREIISKMVGLTEAELELIRAEEGEYKTLPLRPLVRVDDTTSKIYLGQGNNIKINHLIGYTNVNISDEANRVFQNVSDMVENTNQTFYIRELIEQ